MHAIFLIDFNSHSDVGKSVLHQRGIDLNRKIKHCMYSFKLFRVALVKLICVDVDLPE